MMACWLAMLSPITSVPYLLSLTPTPTLPHSATGIALAVVAATVLICLSLMLCKQFGTPVVVDVSTPSGASGL